MASPESASIRAGGLEADSRWQLIERIAASTSLQRSARLRQLLLFLAERCIHGDGGELSEQQIGRAVFGKSADYSPAEDSSVRVHARQLRLKLHEYFDSEGRGERLIAEIPKGSYNLVFRTIETAKPELAVTTAQIGNPQRPPITAMLPWALVCVLLVAVVLLLARKPAPVAQVPSHQIPWPISEVVRAGQTTSIVLADANYGMLRIISNKTGSLNDYLSPDFPRRFLPSKDALREPITNYISNSLLTSYADVAVATELVKLVGASSSHILLRSARDLRPRDLENGNYIFLGSPGSNPWVSLFEDRLNFRESEGVVGRSTKAFRNTHPLPGEQERYEGLTWTGTSGEDYAAISLFSNNSRTGNIMILQGLQQEGTEAAGMLLTEPINRAKLLDALHVSAGSKPAGFEALIKTTAVAGAPAKLAIIATRATR